MIIDHINTKSPIDKGWSGDKKYRALTSEGQVYLLRVAAPERSERMRRGFVQMQRVAELGIPMCLPIEFGTCDEGVYSLQSFIEGEDAEQYIPTLPPKKRLAEREPNQVGFDVQISPIPSSFPLDILPICPAGKAFGLKKICCVKTARTRRRMHF